MIELARHIETLLLKHNCVIVPHLGGFVTHHVAAHHSTDDNRFCPPFRSIGFNPQLLINDGLLVQSYMQTRDTGYPETVRIIDEAVARLKDELQRNGEFRLNGIGTLTMSLDGNYRFTPNEAGILSPELYGLEPFTIERRNDGAALSRSRKADSAPDTSEKRNYVVRINRELVNYAAAAIIAIVFYFAWTLPTTHSDTLAPMPVQAAMKPATPAAAEAAPATAVPLEADTIATTAEPASAAAAAADSLATAAEPAPQGRYALVLSSRVTQKNAERFAQQLRDEGLSQATISVKKKMIRVLYGSYAGETEAYTDLKRLRKVSRHFAEAWVMKTE